MLHKIIIIKVQKIENIVKRLKKLKKGRKSKFLFSTIQVKLLLENW